MSDSEDDFAPSKPPPDSDDDFAPSKTEEPKPKPKLKGEEKKAQETKEFDEQCEQGMAHVEEEEWKDATLCFERALKLDAKTEGSKEVSEERADCAFNLACCHAQCNRLDDAETWLRRSVAWGVRDVDLMKDKHLAPLRAHDVALCMNLSEALRPAPVRQAAVLQRSRRQRSGGAMAALIRQEKERQASNEDEDIDDFWKDEKDDDEYSGSAESEHERRDVFDSDFDEDESESARGVPLCRDAFTPSTRLVSIIGAVRTASREMRRAGPRRRAGASMTTRRRPRPARSVLKSARRRRRRNASRGRRLSLSAGSGVGGPRPRTPRSARGRSSRATRRRTIATTTSRTPRRTRS
jgi:hypothetical protein